MVGLSIHAWFKPIESFGKLLKQNAIWWIEYADLASVDTYNYSDPPELHLGQKQIPIL
jgi:hypothetical protein